MKRNLAMSLAIALLVIIGVETVATASVQYPTDSQTIHNGKCPKDSDDDCKD
ncbi:MAG: hypothetical protein VKL41_11045 [Snowella sp.]|jgi:hypothetical protein|nr:hypothetical protein [Snowella sp.]